MSDDVYELIVAGPAARAIAEVLSEAVIEFLTGALIEHPQQVGHALLNELAGIKAARRGTSRVLYRINEYRGEVVVLRLTSDATSIEPDYGAPQSFAAPPQMWRL